MTTVGTENFFGKLSRQNRTEVTRGSSVHTKMFELYQAMMTFVLSIA